MNELKEDFERYIMKRFNAKNGTIASYMRAVSCVLDYLKIEKFDSAVRRIDEIKMFAHAPKIVNEFLNIYPGFMISVSYIEKGWIKASIKHFELYVESKLKEQLGFICESDKKQLSMYDESYLEDLLNYKDDAKLVTVTRELKSRVLDRSIINDLKNFYNHRCQICEKQFSMMYSVNICEGHHIEHFVKTFNNDADNIIVLCPDHHRLMHSANPTLDRESMQFTYPNGYNEKIILSDHLSKV